MMTRQDFLDHVARRAALIADPGLDGVGHSEQATADDLADADHLVAVAEEFADQVDRENATERTLMPLDYTEAVLILGSRGPVVAHRDVYANDRLAVEAQAGEVDAVHTGLGLLGWDKP